MVENISTTTQRARKDYRDDSAEFIKEAMDIIRHGYLDRGKIIKFQFHELRAIAQLKANNWKIKKGQMYEKQFNKMDGDVYTFRTLPAIGDICQKHKLYGDD